MSANNQLFPPKDTNTSAHVLPQMDLREQESAAAVQDLEIRQMELEAQRKRLEQVMNASFLTSSLFCGLYLLLFLNNIFYQPRNLFPIVIP